MRGSVWMKRAASPRTKAVMTHRTPYTGDAATLFALTGFMLAAWLALSGLALAARTVFGVTHPLPWQQLALATLVLLAAAWTSHATAACSGQHPARASLLRVWLTSGGLLLWGIALTHGTSPLAAATVFPPLIVEEAWAWRRIVARRVEKRPATTHRPSEDRLVQQYTRTVAPGGNETIQGRVVIHIEAGSRMAAAHIAFCPPFLERPQFDARLESLTGSTLKVTQLYAHGARLEIRLPRPADTGALAAVRFTARTA